MSNIYYKNKYLKYKNKYKYLKYNNNNLNGGSSILPEKYIIVTLGAPGSGKTILQHKTKELLGLTNIEFKVALVDDLVENNIEYKNKIKPVIDKISDDCKTLSANDNKINDCIKTNIMTPSDDLIDTFKNTYWKIRKTGCNTVDDDNNPSYDCDNLNDNNIKQYGTNNENFIFETPGVTIPTWFLKKDYIPDNYNVIFSYSIVNINELLIRNKERAYNSIANFIIDSENNPGPRLPEINNDKFLNNVKQICNTLIYIHSNCINKENKLCGERQIDRLLVFDNNNTEMQLIYDSKTSNIDNNEFKELIKNTYGLNDDEIDNYSF